jgi:hypothetical protein
VADKKTVTVNTRELGDAFDFVSVGGAFDHSAYISLDTGKIYWRSTDVDLQEGDLPEDLDDLLARLASERGVVCARVNRCRSCSSSGTRTIGAADRRGMGGTGSSKLGASVSAALPHLRCS